MLFLKTSFGNPWFIAPVVAFVNLEQQKFATEQAKIENSNRKFVEIGKKMHASLPWHCRKGATDSHEYLWRQEELTSLLHPTLTI